MRVGSCAIIPAMELRQLRYFVRVVELGSISRAALDLDLVQSALSQQISRLESELSTRLLQRNAEGVLPTEAGVAFFREAQLTLRHADQAVRSTPALPALLAVHLGVVMALFASLPYGKSAHGVFRMAALLRFAVEKRQPNRLGVGAE